MLEVGQFGLILRTRVGGCPRCPCVHDNELSRSRRERGMWGPERQHTSRPNVTCKKELRNTNERASEHIWDLILGSV